MEHVDTRTDAIKIARKRVQAFARPLLQKHLGCHERRRALDGFYANLIRNLGTAKVCNFKYPIFVQHWLSLKVETNWGLDAVSQLAYTGLYEKKHPAQLTYINSQA